MSQPRSPMKSLIAPGIPSALAALFSVVSVSTADSLSSGTGQFSFDPAAFASVAGGAALPGFEALLPDEVFTASAAASRTGAQIINDELVASPDVSSVSFAMNGATVSNLAGRTTQPTTFVLDPVTPTLSTGAIGLGGVTRWAVNPLLGGGTLLFGDFTVGYSSDRLLAGGSGGFIKGNIAPAAVVFDLLNPQVASSGNTFTLSGDLGLSFEIANFLFSNPADQGRDMGDFTFTGLTAVPEPSSYAAGAALACLGLAAFNRLRDRR